MTIGHDIVSNTAYGFVEAWRPGISQVKAAGLVSRRQSEHRAARKIKHFELT